MWKNIILITKPGVTALILFVAGLNYFQLQNYTFNQSILFATGTAFLGAIIGLITYQYFNL